ncbi:MAG: hypothetical protein ABJA78_07735 [Ferruginibacter sp.]
MKAVKVQYSVQAGYAENNSENIKRVMEDLRQLNSADIKYSSFLLDDKKTFVHFAMFKSTEAEARFSKLDSFKKFQISLAASNPEVLPKVENLSLIGSSYELFV